MATTTNKLKDPNLSEQEQDAIIGAFVRRHENERLRKRWEHKLTTDHGISKQPPAKKRKAVIRKISLAIAAIAASLLFFFTIFPLLDQPGGDELLAVYVSEVSINNTRGGADTDLEVLRRQVANAYNVSDFSAAVLAAESLVSTADASPEDELNLGKAYLRNGNYAQADQTLRRLIGKATDFTTEARYTLGLSLFSAGKNAAAITELQLIKETDGAKIYRKAQELIDKI